MPDITDPEVQKTLPKRIVVDGQTIEPRPVEELRQVQSDIAHKNIARKKKVPFKCFGINFNGSVF